MVLRPCAERRKRASERRAQRACVRGAAARRSVRNPGYRRMRAKVALDVAGHKLFSLTC